MAKLYGVTIETGSGPVFSGTCEGLPLPTYALDYKEAADPPELQVLRETWRIQDVRIRSSTDGAAWVSFFSFINALDRDSFPVKLVFTRDPTGTPTVLRTVGPSTHSRFKIEAVEVKPAPELGGDEGRKVVTCDLVISAEILNEDANDIVRWEQVTRSEDAGGGLKRLVRETHVETVEGTSAAALAAQFGTFDLTTLGDDYTLETNTVDGADVSELDADTENDRISTKADARAVARQWGISVTSSTGRRPNKVGLEVTIEQDAKETITTTVATAEGPGYLDWVKRQAPAVFTSVTKKDQREAKRATYTWVRKQTATATPESLWKLDIETQGGGPSKQFIEIAGNFEPALLEGGNLAWKITVKVEVERRGQALTRKDLLLPGLLGDPYVLITAESTEGEATQSQFGMSSADDLWTRKATYTYRSPRAPKGSVLELVQNAGTSESPLEDAA